MYTKAVVIFRIQVNDVYHGFYSEYVLLGYSANEMLEDKISPIFTGMHTYTTHTHARAHARTHTHTHTHTHQDVSVGYIIIIISLLPSSLQTEGVTKANVRNTAASWVDDGGADNRPIPCANKHKEEKWRIWVRYAQVYI